MVPLLCYKHNDIHSQLINALHLSGALKSDFPALCAVPAAAGGSLGQGAAMLCAWTQCAQLRE